MNCLFAVIALTFTAFLPLSGPVSAWIFLAVVIISVVGIKEQNFLLSPYAFVAFAYLMAFPICYLLPRGFFPYIWLGIPEDAIEYSIRWALRGFCFFALGYLLTQGFNHYRRERPASGCLDDYSVRFIKILGLLSIVGWLAEFMSYGISLAFIEASGIDPESRAEGLGQVWHTLKVLRYAFFSLITTAFFTSTFPRGLLKLSIVVVGLFILDALVIGSKSPIISGVVAFLLGTVLARVRLRRKAIISLALSALVIWGAFSVVAEYRRIMIQEYSSGGDVLNFQTQIASFTDALINSLPFVDADDDVSFEESSLQNILSRLAGTNFSFANLLLHTGRVSPEENYIETWFIPIYAIVPRFLYPEKPLFFDSGKNAREYYGWGFGGVSVSLPGSLYYSHGYAGILYGMFLVGALLSHCFKRTVVDPLRQLTWYAILVMTTISLLDVGQTFHSIVGNTLRFALVLWIVHKLASRWTLRW